MKILALDTATQHCSIAVCNDTTLLAEITIFRQQTHSRHLLDGIHQTISLSGITLGAIDGFAVTRGPGSFTGLRIGLSCVKGLAYALNKSLVSVSSLECLATQAMMITDIDSLLICPLLDARKKEVYFAGFRQQNHRLVNVSREMVLPPEKMALHLDGPCLFVGDGAVLYKDVLASLFKDAAFFAPVQQNYIRAHTIVLLAIDRFKNGQTDNIDGLVPEYIRRSDAERKISRNGL